MVDTEMYDGECSACNTFYNVCKFTDAMLKDIRHLESEIVRLRYGLSTHLPQVDKEMLRSDILSDLADRYYKYIRSMSELTAMVWIPWIVMLMLIIWLNWLMVLMK